MDIKDDEKLVEISTEVDEFLLHLAKKYNASAIELTSIVNARLYTLCEQIEIPHEYYNILRYLMEMQSTSLNPMTIQ